VRRQRGRGERAGECQKQHGRRTLHDKLAPVGAVGARLPGFLEQALDGIAGAGVV
jgi:hypothetical protein